MSNRTVYLVSAGLSFAFSQASVAGAPIFRPDSGEGVCWLVTFEGSGHLNQIHPETGGLVPGTPVRFASNWFTATGGAYANNPSVPTIALFLGDLAVVDFDVPVGGISLFYASSTPVTIEAFDAGGGLIASTTDSANLQPDGFTQWDPLDVDAGADAITRINVRGGNGATGVDDFVACQLSAALIDVEVDLHPGNYPNGVDPFNTNSNRTVDLGVLSTDTFDATTIDVSTATLGDPTLRGSVSAQIAWTTDINNDGILDLVINFGIAHDFDVAGALASTSTEVELWANTVEENVYVLGHDSVLVP